MAITVRHPLHESTPPPTTTTTATATTVTTTTTSTSTSTLSGTHTHRISPFLREFAAGNVGGVAGILSVYPLDTAKIRLQTSTSATYKNTWDVLRSMAAVDGVGALYRGLAAPVFGFGLTFAVSFSAYGYGCRQLAELRGVAPGELRLLDQAAAGAFTGVVQAPFRQVIERIKSVMQVRETTTGKSPYKWSGACAADLVRKEGLVNGLFQGTGSVLLREVPQFAVYYPVYHASKQRYSEHLSPFAAAFLAGGTAGVVQWLPPFYCFDVVKSRMQTALPGTYRSVWQCAAALHAQHGAGVFVRGLSPALLRAFPLHAIIFVGYEGTMDVLGKL